jgi:hypothetical protein
LQSLLASEQGNDMTFAAGSTATPRTAHHDARRWADALALAQVELARLLAGAIAEGRLGRYHYREWLAMESATCRIGALSLDQLAGWHGSQPELHAAVLAWSAQLRTHANLAAEDVRDLGGITAAMPRPLAQWQAFAGTAGGSQRAGEVLGTVLLHSRLLAGPMRPLLAAVSAMSFADGCARYFTTRREQALAPPDAGRDGLLDAYAVSALAAGVQSAAGWHRAALVSILATPAPSA